MPVWVSIDKYKWRPLSLMSPDWHEKTWENFHVCTGKFSEVNDKRPRNLFCVINDWRVTCLGEYWRPNRNRTISADAHLNQALMVRNKQWGCKADISKNRHGSDGNPPSPPTHHAYLCPWNLNTVWGEASERETASTETNLKFSTMRQ